MNNVWNKSSDEDDVWDEDKRRKKGGDRTHLKATEI